MNNKGSGGGHYETPDYIKIDLKFLALDDSSASLGQIKENEAFIRTYKGEEGGS
jgi:hypothetical protein